MLLLEPMLSTSACRQTQTAPNLSFKAQICKGADKSTAIV